jgi:hypothetical protein
MTHTLATTQPNPFRPLGVHSQAPYHGAPILKVTAMNNPRPGSKPAQANDNVKLFRYLRHQCMTRFNWSHQEFTDSSGFTDERMIRRFDSGEKLAPLNLLYLLCLYLDGRPSAPVTPNYLQARLKAYRAQITDS